MDNNIYKKYKDIAMKITKGHPNTEDLLHDLIMQLELNERYMNLTEKEKLFFFVRSFQNQYSSTSSSFYRKYTRMKFNEFTSQYEIIDEQYEEKPSIDWVNETLNNELANRPDFWYDYGIFIEYMKHRKLISLHKKTQIPKYSLRITINSVKKLFRKRWDEYKQNNFE
jgi:hypothetical protein